MKRPHLLLLTALISSVLILAPPPPAHAENDGLPDIGTILKNLAAFISDGASDLQNLQLFAEQIGISKEMLENLERTNRIYHEVTRTVSKGVSAVEAAKYYASIYNDFVYYIETLKGASDIEYEDVRSYISGAWHFLLLASREVQNCREYLGSDIRMTDGDRMIQLKASEKSLRRILGAFSLYMADTLNIIDTSRRIENNYQSLCVAFDL